jgi:hypothetical protein
MLPPDLPRSFHAITGKKLEDYYYVGLGPHWQAGPRSILDHAVTVSSLVFPEIQNHMIIPPGQGFPGGFSEANRDRGNCPCSARKRLPSQSPGQFQVLFLDRFVANLMSAAQTLTAEQQKEIYRAVPTEGGMEVDRLGGAGARGHGGGE